MTDFNEKGYTLETYVSNENIFVGNNDYFEIDFKSILAGPDSSNFDGQARVFAIDHFERFGENDAIKRYLDEHLEKTIGIFSK